MKEQRDKDQMEENDHQKNLNELEKMSDFLKGVVDFGKKFESIRQTKLKEDIVQKTYSSPWVSAKDTKDLKDHKNYLVKRVTVFNQSLSIARWDGSHNQFFVDGFPFPVIVDYWMEIPE